MSLLITRRSVTFLALHKPIRSFTLPRKPAVNKQLQLIQSRSHSDHGDHSGFWKMEKYVSAALLIVTPVAIASPNLIADSIWGVLTVLHGHVGIEAIFLDYLKPLNVGKVLPKLAAVTLYLLSFAALGGISYFNYRDMGFGMAVRTLWSKGK